MARKSCLAAWTCLFLTATVSLAADEPTGFLKLDRKVARGKPQSEWTPYLPREGDLVFYDDHNLFWTMLFVWAGTGPPLHMGIVVKKVDGAFGILEAGPDDTIRVELLDLQKRLPQFHTDFNGGDIVIRQCKKDLTKEQSEALTKFAAAQDGKRYAIGRLLLQGTWFRSRGPIRELILGKTILDRDSWICSELAVAAGTSVKLFDPRVVRANVTYPRDLVDDSRYDLNSVWHAAAQWQPQLSEKKR